MLICCDLSDHLPVFVSSSRILSKEARSYKWSRTYSEANKAKFLHELGKTDWYDGIRASSVMVLTHCTQPLLLNLPIFLKRFFSSKKDRFVLIRKMSHETHGLPLGS